MIIERSEHLSLQADQVERTRQGLHMTGVQEHNEYFQDTVDRRIAELEHTNQLLHSEVRNCRRTVEELRIALKKHEMLVKEIHHRVSNNLQVVASLLSIQEEELDTPLVQKAMQESRNRVKTIAKLHSTLYMKKSLACVDLEYYFHTVIDSLRDLYRRHDIVFTITTDGTVPGEDKVLPLGLIINEMVTNALKHAFPGNRAGSVTVDLRLNSRGMHVLTISDNGAGLKMTREPGNCPTIGLNLITCMVKQLDGTMEITQEKGTTAVIMFPGTGIS